MLITVVWVVGGILLLVLVGVVVRVGNALVGLLRSLAWLSNTLQFRSMIVSIARGVVASTTDDISRQPQTIAEALGVEMFFADGSWTPEGYQILSAWKQAQDEHEQ